MTIQAFNSRSWNGTPISRRTTDGYVNATAMCKANGKQWNDYWRTDRATAYLEALSTETGIPVSGLCLSLKGGSNQGTWVHAQVAVDLARWISAPFAVWMDGWFLEELAGGRVSQVRDTQVPALPAPPTEDTQYAVLLADIYKTVGGDPKESLAVSFTALARKHPDYREVLLENQRLLNPAIEDFGNATRVLEEMTNRLGKPAIKKLTVMAKDANWIAKVDERHLINALLCQADLQFKTGNVLLGGAKYALTTEGHKYGREETRPADNRTDLAWVPQILWKVKTTTDALLRFVSANLEVVK